MYDVEEGMGCCVLCGRRSKRVKDAFVSCAGVCSEKAEMRRVAAFLQLHSLSVFSPLMERAASWVAPHETAQEMGINRDECKQAKSTAFPIY